MYCGRSPRTIIAGCYVLCPVTENDHSRMLCTVAGHRESHRRMLCTVAGNRERRRRMLCTAAGHRNVAGGCYVLWPVTENDHSRMLCTVSGHRERS